MKSREIIKILPKEIQRIIEEQSIFWDEIEEIRLRIGQPIRIIEGNKERVFSPMVLINKMHIRECLEYVSSYSLYAYEEEIRQGFITIEGGHRIGVVGKVYMENNEVKHQKYINSINIRVAHQVIGSANEIISYIRDKEQVHNTLIISPPRCGKTTILRDVIRQLSKGTKEDKGMNVSVVDERSEIAATFEGKPSNDLGPRCDVLDACPKVVGMRILLRSMSPNVIAVDEVGSEEDINTILYSISSGCTILATIHGRSIEELKHNPYLRGIFENQSFTRFILIRKDKNYKRVIEVYDNKYSILYSSLGV